VVRFACEGKLCIGAIPDTIFFNKSRLFKIVILKDEFAQDYNSLGIATNCVTSGFFCLRNMAVYAIAWKTIGSLVE
jgi:hypothetical protein